MKKVRDAGLVVLGTAVVIRLASWALAPFVPYVIVVVVLVGIMSIAFKRS